MSSLSDLKIPQLEENLFLFNGNTAAIDLSWILKLTQQDEEILAASTSSPARSDSTGYCSSPEGRDPAKLVNNNANDAELDILSNRRHQHSHHGILTLPQAAPPTPFRDSEIISTLELAPFCSENQTLLKPISAPGTMIPRLNMPAFKNYAIDSQSPRIPSITLEMNGYKYWGLAVDKFSDKIFLTDRNTSDIVVVDPNTRQAIFRFGQRIPGGMNLFRPTGVMCDNANKRLIVCDKDNHRVAFFSFDGQFISSFGKKGFQNGQFSYPWDADISPFGDHIAVTDSRNHRIQLFDRFGNFLKKFSVFETNPFEYKTIFDYPRGITFDKFGANIYATDFNTNNVLGLNLNSWESRLLVPFGKMSRPQGITVDEANNILVCDSRRRCIRVMTPQGDLRDSIFQIGSKTMDLPGDLDIMRGGEVAVIDISGHIRFF